MQLQGYILGKGNLSRGMRNLVFGFLVLELELATAGVNGLSGGAPPQLLERGRTNVEEMVGAGVGDDGVPNDGRIGCIVRAGPVGGDEDKEVLGVPSEEAGEVGIEGEAEDGVLFFLVAVVVRTALDDLDVVGADVGSRVARGKEVGSGDEGAKDAGDCCEEAKDVLDAVERVVHGWAREMALGAATSRERCGKFAVRGRGGLALGLIGKRCAIVDW